MPYTQADRLIAIDSPLGPDVLLPYSMNGQKGISHLFNFALNLFLTNVPIIKNVTVKVSGDRVERFTVS